MQLADRDRHARHHEGAAEAVDALAREEPGDAAGRDERGRAQDGERDPDDEQRTPPDPIGGRPEHDERRDQDADVDGEQERDDARAEAVPLLVDREQRRGQVAAGEEQHLRGHHEAETRSQRPRCGLGAAAEVRGEDCFCGWHGHLLNRQVCLAQHTDLSVRINP